MFLKIKDVKVIGVMNAEVPNKIMEKNHKHLDVINITVVDENNNEGQIACACVNVYTEGILKSFSRLYPLEKKKEDTAIEKEVQGVFENAESNIDPAA